MDDQPVSQPQPAEDSLDAPMPPDPGLQPETTTTSTPTNQPPVNQPVQAGSNKFLAAIRKRWSVYLAIFFIMAAALAVVGVLIYNNQKQPNSLANQTLTPAQLSNLAGSNQSVGNANEVLTIQSSSIFNGQVLVKGQLQVANTLKVGNTLTANGLDTTGSSQINQLQVNQSLAIAGNTTLQGSFNQHGDLSVTGSGSFSGNLTASQISATSLNISGDLIIDHHIDSNGTSPSRTTLAATGSGGSTSISGNDTAGTITINTGTGATIGCFVTVYFASSYSSTPHVLLTPVGSAGLSYYVNRSSTNFSICSNSTPSNSQTYIFDYFVID